MKLSKASETYKRLLERKNRLQKELDDIDVFLKLYEKFITNTEAAIQLGKAGGISRASKLTAEQRATIAQNAANQRWKTK